MDLPSSSLFFLPFQSLHLLFILVFLCFSPSTLAAQTLVFPSPSSPSLPAITGMAAGAMQRERIDGESFGKEGMKIVKHFYLWTNENPGNSSSQQLDPYRPSSLTKSFFRAGKTFVIVHGFMGWGIESWILHLKDKLLRVEESNVISVDWPAGTAWWLPSYYIAVGRVPVVAKDLSALLLGLATHCGQELKDIHIIGHSLGAHVAGLAAAPLQKVGRISGLDPAGLTFHKVPPSQRLDSSDADYVDVIHTNGCHTFNQWVDCYGINENLGHSDFWPNGGEHQPACVKRKTNKVLSGEIGCSHEMAYLYYIESIDYSIDQTFYLARPCSTWTNYKTGVCTCGKETQYMGFLVNVRLNGTFYLSTNAAPPYAHADKQCLPGSATSPGIKIIRTTLILTSAFIVACGCVGGIVKQVKRIRRTGNVNEQQKNINNDSSDNGACSDDNVVVVNDQEGLVK